MFVNMDRQRQCAFAAIVVDANSFDMFNANELKEGTSHSMDSNVRVWNVCYYYASNTKVVQNLDQLHFGLI
jgi:hypothetical protein